VADPEPPAKDALAGARLLVVDDEKDARYFLSLVLRRFGAEVHAAASAFEALELFRRHRPDALISDIGMPEASGYDLIGWIRQEEAEVGSRRVAALALTAFVQVADRERALEHGFDQHMGKPFEPLQVVRVVAELLGRTPQPG
jgi:CheY-like chemotaxis protein